jgi:alanine-glyoxylate transaminase/serine-glyoxylate transaminase/serine-pyruvate transaminase
MHTVKLMIPGPVDISDDIRKVMGGPMVAHYGEEWVATFQETVGLLKQVFQTTNELYLIPGSGSAGLDAAFGSLFASGERVLIPVNGYFGQRLIAIATSYGLDVTPIQFPLGLAVDPDVVRSKLAEHSELQGLAVVHHETSTGVLNPVQEIAAAARERDLPIIVDAVASMGGVPVKVDEWGLDVVVTVTNKCLAIPPALVPVSVSPRAWAALDARPQRGHGWYLNLGTWREYARNWADWHPYPTTLPTHNVLALRSALLAILNGGLEQHYQRHVVAAQRVRSALGAMGFELFVEGEYACPLITAVKARPEFPVAELLDFLRAEAGIMLGAGIGELRGKIFRVGHMGRAIEDEYVDALLNGVADFLRGQGLA